MKLMGNVEKFHSSMIMIMLVNIQERCLNLEINWLGKQSWMETMDMDLRMRITKYSGEMTWSCKEGLKKRKNKEMKLSDKLLSKCYWMKTLMYFKRNLKK